MDNAIDFYINNILTIIRKSGGSEGFVFDCPRREADGFVYFTKGNGTFTDESGHAYSVGDSTLVLLKIGDKYRFDIVGEYSYITSAFSFMAKDNDTFAPLPKVITCSKSQEYEIEEILDHWQSRNLDSYMRCKLCILNFYLDLMSSIQNTQNTCDEIVSKAVKFIRENFKTNFSGKELASYCGVSQSNLRMRFRSQIGTNITGYRDSLRITVAKEMLSSHLFSIKETAYELGYCDVYHFSKVFTAVVGTTPAKFSKIKQKS
ncbi:MAG: helix-turn-helix domain-containing protein [Ruminococcaceae bacterium]|nr:helix-turn-helix domain-containing protein [Oscillospiraceae bacterium]